MKTLKPFFSLFAIAVVLVTASCSASRETASPYSEKAKSITAPGKAIVYVYRISSYGWAVGLPVDCNKTSLETLFPKKYYLCVLDPGKYIFTCQGENEDDIVVNAQADRTYYLELSAQMGWVQARCRLEVPEPGKAVKDLQKCKMAGMNAAARAILESGSTP